MISALTTLLTVALVVLAAAIAFWRLLSHKWQMGKSQNSGLVLAGSAATVLFLAGWFKASVFPYRIPGAVADYAGYPDFQLLQVFEKRGLQFHEAYLSVNRDGRYSL